LVGPAGGVTAVTAGATRSIVTEAAFEAALPFVAASEAAPAFTCSVSDPVVGGAGRCSRSRRSSRPSR
jgi:hypothetical protein